MHAMNHYGNSNRGFGGQPQPQRQGVRRGNRGGGGFRQSRFDNNPQRNFNQNEGQRPNENKPIDKPAGQNQQPVQPQQVQPQQPAQNQQSRPNQQQNANKQSPNQPTRPNQPQTPAQPLRTNQQTTPNQTQRPNQPQTPAQQPRTNQQQTPAQQPRPNQQQTPAQQPRPNQQQTPVQSQQSKPAQQQNQPRPNQPAQNQAANQPKLQEQPKQQQQNPASNKPDEIKDTVDNVSVNVPPPLMQQNTGFKGSQGNLMNQNQQQNQQKNMNGAPFGGPNRQGGMQGGGTWAQGNKQGNRQFGGPRQSGPGGPRQGGPGGPWQGGPGMGGNQRGNQMGGRGPREDMSGMPPSQREEIMLANKLKELVGPLIDLPPLDSTEIKFNGRSRLYIGNLPNDTSEEDITQMFSAFGETAELFVNKEKNFGFIKMDYRVNAEKAKRELDGQMRNGRTLRVRFAPHNSAIHVKNLPPFVSNELLYKAFEIFGKIERAYVRVDERGKALGEGVVEYARKPSALAAIRNCSEKCFFLTSSLRPVIVESFEEPDEFDGYPEKNLPKKHPEFLRAREMGPRFSEASSFEHEYGTRWKQLHELHKQKEDTLKKELAAEEEKLEAQMEYAKYEHETEQLREQLRAREQDRERQKRTWEAASRAAEERRESERVGLRRAEEQLEGRLRARDDELRRRQQENTLFVQAQRLNSLLDRQEQGYDAQSPMDGNFREQFEMGRGFEDGQQRGGWEGPRQIEDFPNKRRRF